MPSPFFFFIYIFCFLRGLTLLKACSQAAHSHQHPSKHTMPRDTPKTLAATSVGGRFPRPRAAGVLRSTEGPRGWGKGLRAQPGPAAHDEQPHQHSSTTAPELPTTMQRPTPLVRRGEGVSQAAGTLPRATSPSTPGRKRRFLFLFLKKKGEESQAVAGSHQGREGGRGGAEKTENFLTHQFYRETPSTAAGWCLHGLCG